MGTLTRMARGAAKALSIYSSQGLQGRFLGWDGTIIGGSHGLPGERRYETMIGDGRGSSLAVSLLNWMMREQPLAPPAMWQLPAENDTTAPQLVPQIVRQHDLLNLLRFPNADPNDRRMRRGYFSGRVLWQASSMDYSADGNCYWWKRRDEVGRVRQLWWLPSWCMDPRAAPEALPDSPYIWKYRYTVNGKETWFDPWDIVHVRFGQDPMNPRKGLSQFRALLREFATDEVAARHTVALLINAGIPGLVIIPDAATEVTDEGQKEVKERFKEEFGDDRRGEPIVLKAKAAVQQLAWSPDQMKLGDIRDIPEERVSSALGIPAAVVGFGTGLQQVKVGATMDALRLMGWEGAVLPTDQAFASEVETQLLHEFIAEDAELDRTMFGFDFSQVPILVDLQLKRATVEASLVGSTIKKRSEARATLGLPVSPEDDVYVPNAGVVAQTRPGNGGTGGDGGTGDGIGDGSA